MTLNDTEATVKRMVLMLLGDRPEVTTEVISSSVSDVLGLQPPEQQAEVSVERLAREIQEALNVWTDAPTVLDDEDQSHVEWLADRRGEIEWNLWNRYRQYLTDVKDWAPSVVRRLDEITDQVLRRLEDPSRRGHHDRRGMVVGQVQSGKTANYTGLICKAIDAGYRLIIVLAGTDNALRSQTQLRLDEGVLGFDTQKRMLFDQANTRMGVGLMKGHSFHHVNSLTSSKDSGDFNKSVVENAGINVGGKDPLILVVKKNKRILNNVISWATSTMQDIQPGESRPRVRRVPLLVIDDECDHASVNTKDTFDQQGNFDPDIDPTAINACIRRLLEAFEQRAYLGYTATPFANIFIFKEADSPDYGPDLFPRSFIVNLKRSSEYIGANLVFGLDAGPTGVGGRAALPVVRTVSDADTWMPSNHKNGYVVPDTLPESLHKALRSFILTCAARRVRGDDKEHNSMLIHVTRYVSVQSEVADLIRQQVAYLKDRIEFGDGRLGDRLMDELRQLWEEDFVPTTSAFADPALSPAAWSAVSDELHRAASKIEVREVNGTAQDALEYYGKPKGVSVIAIGGNKLSRGLTLEGLSVSYYLRSTRMYDTLLQMGRWFGYRRGYADLCRLYTTGDLQRWYKDVTLASEELSEQLDEMMLAGGTPEDFGFRVRNSPAGLLITARAKLRTGLRLRLSFAGSISETIMFRRDGTVEDNFRRTVSFVASLGGAKSASRPARSPSSTTKVWRDVPGDRIAQFLRAFASHPGASKAQTGPMADYVEAQMRSRPPELGLWTVGLLSNPGNPVSVGDLNIGLTTRARFPPDEPIGDTYSIRRLVSPADESLDLDADQVAAALSRTREAWQSDPGRSKRTTPPDIPSGLSVRGVRDPGHGLLLLYLLDPEDGQLGAGSAPVVGLAVSFPVSNSSTQIEYTVNNTYWEQEFASL
jgi:hypothetical protein